MYALASHLFLPPLTHPLPSSLPLNSTHPPFLLGRLPLPSFPLPLPILLSNPIRHKLLHIRKVLGHHGGEPVGRGANDVSKPSLHDLAGQVRVRPAGMVIRHVHLRVVLVPGRELLVHVRFHGPQTAIDEVDDSGDAGFDVDCEGGGLVNR